MPMMTNQIAIDYRIHRSVSKWTILITIHRFFLSGCFFVAAGATLKLMHMGERAAHESEELSKRKVFF